jgi:hypothetical protein
VRGDLLVPVGETAARRSDEAAAPVQVDADLVDLQELGDALDRGLERVRE